MEDNVALLLPEVRGDEAAVHALGAGKVQALGQVGLYDTEQVAEVGGGASTTRSADWR